MQSEVSNVLEGQSALVVDCKNQICPKPVFMTKEAIAREEIGKVIEIIVNDEGSKQNVLKYCWNHGQEILKSYQINSDFHLIVKKSPEKKVDNQVPVIGPCGTRWD
ncbi:MAG: sulfurtransferase TusA family protein [Nitrososphaerota archaeon]|nr:sulfurtransferase TusA family protein [Nitrososphaerota archaeon]